MRHLSYISLVLLLFTSCKDDVELHTVWVKKHSPDTSWRYSTAGFSIGDKGFIGLGSTDNQMRTDWWEFSSGNGEWTRKKDFPGGGRIYAFSASDGKRGFTGLGYHFSYTPNSTTITPYQDVWQYDADSDQWSALPNPPFRYEYLSSPASFVTNNQLFILTKQELWTLDLVSNTWQRKNNPPFTVPFAYPADQNANAMVINDEVYVIMAKDDDNTSAFDTDLWKYIPSTDSWTLAKSKYGSSLSANTYWSAIGTTIYKLEGYFDPDFDTYNNKQTTFKLISYPDMDERFDLYSATTYSIGGSIYYYFSSGEYWQYIP